MREIHGNCEYVFCPVGQGLFVPGRLAFSFEPLPQSGPSKEFYWAYDCGASTQSALLREVGRVRSALSMPYRRQLNTLGLFVLSHFDKDHISGIGRLLNGVTVEWLVLPYLYPTERLAIGVQSDEDDPDFLRFLIDPAAYVAGLPGVTVRNVAYIMPGGESPPDALQEPPQFLPDGPDGFVDTRKADDHAGEPDPSLRQRAEGPRIHQVDSKSPFTVAGLWEFCFHNPLRQDQAETLRARVGSIYSDFMGRPEADRDYKAFIDRLKPLFAQVFGESGRARNDISLIAYSGPIRSGLEHACLSIRGNPIFPVNTSSRAWPWEDLMLLDGWRCGWNGLPSESVGILLTGDITMSGALGVQLREHFRAPRWREIAILQAPHHGSKHSWELGTEGLWDQAWTVFSAGRFNDFGHPDRLVVSDLANRGPLFVDEYVGAHWIGCAQWKA